MADGRDNSTTASKPPPKKVISALERVFDAEINGRLPFQSKAAIYRQLCDEGLLQPMGRRFGTGAFAVTASGYQLTHAGRYLYCGNCEDTEREAME